MTNSLEDTRSYFSLCNKLNPQFETNLPSRCFDLRPTRSSGLQFNYLYYRLAYYATQPKITASWSEWLLTQTAEQVSSLALGFFLLPFPLKLFKFQKSRDAIWSTPKLVATFLDENSDLSDEDRALVSNWARFSVGGTFAIVDFAKEGSLVADLASQKVYCILGVTSPLANQLPHTALPQLAELRLLPFDQVNFFCTSPQPCACVPFPLLSRSFGGLTSQKIVWDGFLQSYSNMLPQSLQASYSQLVRDSIANRTLIHSLAPTATTQPEQATPAQAKPSSAPKRLKVTTS